MNEMHDFRHDVLVCPTCGARIDASLAVSGETAPTPGDATICIACASAAIYGEGLRLRKPTPEEWDMLAQHPDYRRAMFALQAIISDQKGEWDG